MGNKLEKQEACQLYIEQEIEIGLAGGKTKYAIGKEIAAWIKKVFLDLFFLSTHHSESLNGLSCPITQ